ncbi:hypothetical protein C8R44DRAFT_977259 [Mycena epipterygia]|nr:hypothetical protein C8R44DRAFT_977259 [Mycena epipterygia]
MDEDKPETAKELYEEYSFLHMAIDDTDPPLAYEMIRHGTLIEKTNGKGETPLLQALERTWEQHSFPQTKANAPDPLPPAVMGYKQQIEDAERRVRYIAVLLIGQHANVNSTISWQGKIVSTLHFACAMKDWDLVALLLMSKLSWLPQPLNVASLA